VQVHAFAAEDAKAGEKELVATARTNSQASPTKILRATSIQVLPGSSPQGLSANSARILRSHLPDEDEASKEGCHGHSVDPPDALRRTVVTHAAT